VVCPAVGMEPGLEVVQEGYNYRLRWILNSVTSERNAKSESCEKNGSHVQGAACVQREPYRILACLFSILPAAVFRVHRWSDHCLFVEVRQQPGSVTPPTRLRKQAAVV
jgi:hypothetical protein